MNTLIKEKLPEELINKKDMVCKIFLIICSI